MPSSSAPSLHSAKRYNYADNFEEVQDCMQMELNQTMYIELPSYESKKKAWT